MRRSIVLATVLAATTAILGACETKPAENKVENKPVVASTPATSPSTSPGNTTPAVNASPKTNSSPEVKKPETKAPETDKETKPATNVNANAAHK